MRRIRKPGRWGTLSITALSRISGIHRLRLVRAQQSRITTRRRRHDD